MRRDLCVGPEGLRSGAGVGDEGGNSQSSASSVVGGDDGAEDSKQGRGIREPRPRG